MSDLSINDFPVKTKISQALIEQQLKIKELLYDYNHSRPSESAQRSEILRQIFKSCHNPRIEPPFRCDLGFNISLGRVFFANTGLCALDFAPIEIGDFVILGPNVQLLASSHPIDLAERVLPYACGKPIKIGSKVWIGGGAIVLGGVSIGQGSVIGAGSVVTKDIPDNAIAVGNPCRVIRTIEHSQLPALAEIQQLYAELGVNLF